MEGEHETARKLIGIETPEQVLKTGQAGMSVQHLQCFWRLIWSRNVYF